METELMQRIAEEVIASLPEDSPLLPHIKDGGDTALVAILVALLFLPPEEMRRIVRKVMDEKEEQA